MKCSCELCLKGRSHRTNGLVSSDALPLHNSLSDARDVVGAELGTLLSGEHGFAQDFIDNVIPHVGLLHVHRAFKTCRALRDAVRAYMAALPTQTFENYLPRALRPLAAPLPKAQFADRWSEWAALDAAIEAQGPKDRCPCCNSPAWSFSLPKDKLFWNALHFTKKTVKVSFPRGCSHRACTTCWMRAGDNDGGGSLCPKCGEDVLDREGNGNLIESIHNAIMRQAARQLGSPYEPSTYLDGDDLDLPRPEEEPVDPQFEYTAEGWMRERDEEAALYASQELLDGVEDDESHTDEQEEVEAAWLEEQMAMAAAMAAPGQSLAEKTTTISVELQFGTELFMIDNANAAIIDQANELMGLEAEGTLEEQADRLLDEIARVRHLTHYGP